jgi:hypothetical protein
LLRNIFGLVMFKGDKIDRLISRPKKSKVGT